MSNSSLALVPLLELLQKLSTKKRDSPVDDFLINVGSTALRIFLVIGQEPVRILSPATVVIMSSQQGYFSLLKEFISK